MPIYIVKNSTKEKETNYINVTLTNYYINR